MCCVCFFLQPPKLKARSARVVWVHVGMLDHSLDACVPLSVSLLQLVTAPNVGHSLDPTVAVVKAPFFFFFGVFHATRPPCPP